MSENKLLEKYNNLEDESARIEFLNSIAKLQDREALDVFKEAMGDTSWRVRKTAIDGLIHFYDLSAVISLLLDLVHEEENANLRNSAIEGLVRLGKNSMKKIIEVLPHENDEIKKFYVDILGEIGDSSVTPYLIKMMDTKDDNLLSALIEVLGKLGGPEVVDILLEVLDKKRDNINIVFCVFGALKDILSRHSNIKLPIEKFSPFLNEPLLRKAFLELAGYIPDPTIISYILENLNAPQKGIREAAYRALYKYYTNNPDQKDRLVEAIKKQEVKKKLIEKTLHSFNPETKNGAALVLAVKKDFSAIPQILRSMEDNRDFYLEIMEYFGKDIVNVIHDICFDFDEETKSFMCKIIARMGTEQSEALLLDLLESGSETLNLSVAEALAKVGTEDSVEPLVKYLLRTESTDTAEAMINALKRLNRDYPSTVARVVEKYLETCNNYYCKRNILWLIGETGLTEYWKKVTLFLKENDPELRKWALRTLKQLRVKDSFFQVQPLCFDEDEKVRIEAIKTLAAIGGEEALDYFKILKEDPNFWIRLESLKALEEILGDDVVEHLKDKIEDPIGAVAVIALEILSRHWKSEYKELLKKAFYHRDPEVIHTALEIAIDKDALDVVKTVYPELDKETRKKLIKSLYRLPRTPRLPELLKDLLQLEEDQEIKQALTGLADAR